MVEVELFGGPLDGLMVTVADRSQRLAMPTQDHNTVNYSMVNEIAPIVAPIALYEASPRMEHRGRFIFAGMR